MNACVLLMGMSYLAQLSNTNVYVYLYATMSNICVNGIVKVRSYIAQYPGLTTDQGGLHCILEHNLNFSRKYPATLQLMREDYS